VTSRLTRAMGGGVVTVIVLLALAAPFVSPNDPSRQYRNHLVAPPMPVRFVDAGGRWTRPFVYPVRVVDRLEHRFVEDRTQPMPLRLFAGGRLLSVGETSAGPWFPLGSDRLGRDVWARIVHGARLSLAVAASAVTGAMLLGLILGAAAGYLGGAIDLALMRLAEFVFVMPVLYVILAARASLPLVLGSSEVFVLVTTVLTALGWPAVARGVRAIVAAEATREYAIAARAAGASPPRLVFVHLVPATMGFLRAKALMLVPAAIMAETTLSFVGLGFEADSPSWGTLLRESADVRTIADAPWLLSAAAAIVLLVFGLNLATARSDRGEANSWT
jgi:peptide/nickel transport system permease protein